MATGRHTAGFGTRRILTRAVVVVLVASFAHFAYLRITIRPTPRPEHWAARIAALDPPPPAALSAEEVYALLSNRPWEQDAELAKSFHYGHFDADQILAGPWDADRPEIAATDKVFRSDEFIQARAAVMSAARTGWYFPVDPSPAGFMPSYTVVRAWSRLLVAHSRWVRQTRRDLDAAAADWVAALEICRNSSRSRLLIGWLSESALLFIIGREMTCAAREGDHPRNVRALAEAVDRAIGPPQTRSMLLEGERLYIHSILEYKFVRERGQWIDVSQTLVADGWSAPAPLRVLNLFSPLFHDLPTASARHDLYFSSVGGPAAALSSSGPEPTPPTVLDGCLWSLDVFSRSPNLYYRGRCYLDAALATVAVAEHHRRQGRYPDTLDALVPDLLPRVPVDYMDGADLRYCRTADGYVLYSIGADGIDNGGASRNAKPWLFGPDEGPGNDVVFSAIVREQHQDPRGQ